jgi:hypothetical protein
MTDIRTEDTAALRLQRTFAAPPEAVFDATTVPLAHTGIRTEASRARREHGWSACLDNLAERVFGG